jgi:hypothetical protein
MSHAPKPAEHDLHGRNVCGRRGRLSGRESRLGIRRLGRCLRFRGSPGRNRLGPACLRSSGRETVGLNTMQRNARCLLARVRATSSMVDSVEKGGGCDAEISVIQSVPLTGLKIVMGHRQAGGQRLTKHEISFAFRFVAGAREQADLRRR